MLAGSTGEAPTLSDDEKCRLWELAVSECPAGTPIVAGTGTYDTRHSAHLTERATEIGVSAVLVVTPYYNKPNRRGIKAHFETVAAATDRPIVVYNIPSRAVIDLPNDLLAELAQIPNVSAVKQARYEDMAPIDGLDLLAGNDEVLGKVMELGGSGGILVASHLVGREMRRVIDEPENRRRDRGRPARHLRGADRDHQPDPRQGRPEHDRPGRGRAAPAPRRGERGGEGRDPARPRTPQAAHRGVSPRGTLRVLPLGGLGEIGKNMMVLEYDDRIVVVDTGLMFPTPDQLGIDLVLPDFTYLRERADDIEAIVLTHGHEDHVGALPFVLRELDRTPRIYGGPLTAAMVRSKLDEHRLKDVDVQDVLATETFEAGPFSIEMVKMAHSIPDSFAVAVTCELGTTLVTGDYKFDQTPVDGVPADVARLAELGREGLLLLCGDSTNADRAGMSPSESSVGPKLEEVFARCEGRIVVTCFASNIHRVQQVVDAAAVLGRKVSLVGRSMRKNVNIGRMLGHIDVPEGMLVGAKEIEDFPDHKLVVISTGSQGEPLSALRRMAHADHPQRGAARRRHGDLLRHPDPRQRARGERDDRPHLPPRRRRDHRRRRARARLRPRLRGGAEADAQPDQAASTCCPCTATTGACACTPSWPRPWACRQSRSSAARTACRSRSTPRARASASASRRA